MVCGIRQDTRVSRSLERTFEDADGGREVIDSPCGLEGSGHDRDRRDEIVGESVVEIPLLRRG